MVGDDAALRDSREFSKFVEVGEVVMVTPTTVSKSLHPSSSGASAAYSFFTSIAPQHGPLLCSGLRHPHSGRRSGFTDTSQLKSAGHSSRSVLLAFIYTT